MARRVPLLLPRARALIALIRPGNALLAYAAVLVGGVLSGGPAAFGSARVHLAALAVVCIASGANADNDRLDLEADRLNRPARPLPAGLVSERAARWLWGGLTVVGLGAAAGVSAWHGGVALGAAGALAAYSRWWKAWPFVGNMVVAGLLALALVYGGAAAGAGQGALVGAAFALLTNLARELVKDAEDVAGDRVAGRRTLALQIGVRRAVRGAQAMAGLAFVLLPLPYAALGFGGLYLVAGLACAAALARVLTCTADATGAHRASAALKLAMVAGVVALALGRVAP